MYCTPTQTMEAKLCQACCGYFSVGAIFQNCRLWLCGFKSACSVKQCGYLIKDSWTFGDGRPDRFLGHTTESSKEGEGVPTERQRVWAVEPVIHQRELWTDRRDYREALESCRWEVKRGICKTALATRMMTVMMMMKIRWRLWEAGEGDKTAPCRERWQRQAAWGCQAKDRIISSAAHFERHEL